MNRKIILFVSLIALCSIKVLTQTKGKYTNLFSEEKLKSTVKFLSDDGFEGRAPGSRGGELAAKYIANQLEMIGVKPANNGSYFQPVSLVAVKANPNTTLNIGAAAYKFGDEFVAFTGAQTENVNLDSELVFVGYGIDAPEQKWNDYKGNAADYRGKILVMMVNDPPATKEEPNLFGGKALTYYGRWTYKYEEAARRGAAGVILIHTTESAGYGWNVVRTSNGGLRFDIARAAESKTPFLQMRSWMTEETARKIFAQAGKNLDQMREQAKSRNFQPVKLGLNAKIDINSELQRLDSNNVVGVLPGSDAQLKDEYVVYTAHWDHLGVGAPNEKGDTIYNGALDNASGVAQILAIAEAITKLPASEQPKRSQVFLFTTAEEQGLLGAEWYAANPVFPLEKTAANINIDGGNFYGLTTNYGALGAERSSLQPFVNEVLRERQMTYLPDARPEQGSFFRSDHFPFAKGGVPALSIRNGDDYVGKPKDFSKKLFAEFNQKHYHQPSDEFRDDWRFDGMTQVLDISLAIGLRASNTPKLPAFNQSDEFARAQPNRK
ncbi:MAG TPA: M28 family metallopeptidase [Pyrinomonadaceae bacterium]|nr:M28 family metallopeptidase [Pyrinomonadaceae bacterium]